MTDQGNKDKKPQSAEQPLRRTPPAHTMTFDAPQEEEERNWKQAEVARQSARQERKEPTRGAKVPISTMDLIPPQSGVLVSETPAVLGKRVTQAEDSSPHFGEEKHYTPEALDATGALQIATPAEMPPSGEFVEWTASKALLIAKDTMGSPDPADGTLDPADFLGVPPKLSIISNSQDDLPTDRELFIERKPKEPVKPHDPLVGCEINGRFVLRALLGQGGMGKVYLAEQKGLARPVAIKLLHDELTRQAERKLRFEREAQAMTRFVHPNAVMVYDFGDWEGRSYIAMEYLQGRSLEEIIEQEYPLTEDRIIHLLSQVCDVLISAHGVGLIHRDLKPENIMILKGREGEEIVKVVDFGLAVLVGTSPQERLTVEGVTMGTPYYMSPEQCRGQMDLDIRSDIYSLGVILYEMLCKEVPFTGDNMMAVLMQQMFVEPTAPSIRAKGHKINLALEKLSLQSLAKESTQRPQDATVFLEGLQAAKQKQANNDVKRFLEQADRTSRAEAVGLPAISMAIEAQDDPLRSATLFVVESTTDPSHSIAASLSANGYRIKRFAGLDKLLAADLGSLVGPIVVDLRPPKGATWEQVEHALQKGFGELPVFLVGADEDFTIMNKALESGVAGYVASSDVMNKLPRLLRKVMRRFERKKK